MRILLSCAIGVLSAAMAASAELKVATLDLERALTNHVQLAPGLERLRLQEVSFVKELDRLRLEGRRLQSQIEELDQQAHDSILSAELRESRRKEGEQKRIDFSAFRVRYEQFEAAGVDELRGQSVRLRRTLVADVLVAAREIGEREGFNLILNANRVTPAASDVIFSRGVEDVTDRVIARLKAAKASLPTAPLR